MAYSIKYYICFLICKKGWLNQKIYVCKTKPESEVHVFIKLLDGFVEKIRALQWELIQILDLSINRCIILVKLFNLF